MIFTETKLKGAFVIDLERRDDERGFFARAFCQNEFREHGLKSDHRPGQHRLATCIRARYAACTSSIRRRLKRSSCAARAARSSISSWTCDPKAQLISSISRSSSTKTIRRALYVPERFAHGYQVLRDNTDTSYQVGEFYTPSAEGGLMYNDPRLGPEVAAAGLGDFGQGSEVSTARRDRA